MNREEWLNQATLKLGSLFPTGYSAPDVHVSVGWPSRGGLSEKKRVIGQCWNSDSSEDGVPHVFISPVLQVAEDVLAVLLHELVHATVGTEEGHKGAFISLAKELGLQRPWTATVAGDELKNHLKVIASELPAYPHKKLVPTPAQRKKQTTRMIKLECPEDGYTVRTTRKWLDVGVPVCPCGVGLEQQEVTND